MASFLPSRSPPRGKNAKGKPYNYVLSPGMGTEGAVRVHRRGTVSWEVRASDLKER